MFHVVYISKFLMSRGYDSLNSVASAPAQLPAQSKEGLTVLVEQINDLILSSMCG